MGWVENDWEPKYDGEKFVNQAWEFLYCIYARDPFRMELSPTQYINHFQGTKGLTTKIGLTHNMKNLIWHHNIDIGTLFPQSFDLSDPGSDEFKDFKEDFKFG